MRPAARLTTKPALTLGDLIDRARLAGEPKLITRYGKPGTVVASADWCEDAANCLEQSADGPRV
jgi:hypothetical protein